MSAPAGAAHEAIPHVRIDHVAVAVESWALAWPRYVQRLGGRWRSGGLSVGFGPAQLEFANHAKVEVLQPWLVEQNPFLRRFLDHSGPGPHHLTFKVGDLGDALDRASSHGFSPIGVDMSDPGWKEAFIHPTEATGVVIQLAQALVDWESPAPEGFPSPHPQRSDLRWIAHAVRSLDEGRRLFVGLLGADERALRPAAGAGWEGVELTWPGAPLAVRLVAPAGGGSDPLDAWIGDRSGRVHHLGFGVADRSPMEDAEPAAHDTPGIEDDDLGSALVVPPERNHGARLALLRSSPGPGAGPL